MAYLCQTCKGEYDAPTKVPRIGFVGRYAPRCPNGHVMSRLPRAGWSFLIGVVQPLLVYYVLAFLLAIFGEYREGTLAIAILWALAAATSLATTVVLWLRARNASAPLNKAATPNILAAAGIIVGAILSIAFAWSRYIVPVKNEDVVLSPASFAGKDFSVRGKVRSVSINKEDVFIDLDNNVTIQSTRTNSIPSAGEFVHSFGRAYINQLGSLTFVEQFRFGARVNKSANVLSSDIDMLVRALNEGDSSTVNAILLRGVDVNAVGEDASGGRWTPLELAAWNGDIATIQLLLEHGADVRIKGYVDGTALHYARENPDVIKLLVAKGADVNAKKYGGNTPLHEERDEHNGGPEIVKALLNSGADINVQNDAGETPLVKLLKSQLECRTTYGLEYTLPVVRAILDGHPNLSIADRQGNTPRTLVDEIQHNCGHEVGKKAAAALARMIEEYSGRSGP